MISGYSYKPTRLTFDGVVEAYSKKINTNDLPCEEFIRFARTAFEDVRQFEQIIAGLRTEGPCGDPEYSRQLKGLMNNRSCQIQEIEFRLSKLLNKEFVYAELQTLSNR